MEWVWLLVGLFGGSMIGFFTAAVIAPGSRADREEEAYLRGRDTGWREASAMLRAAEAGEVVETMRAADLEEVSR